MVKNLAVKFEVNEILSMLPKPVENKIEKAERSETGYHLSLLTVLN